jgi:hypothetical protein
MAASGTRNFNGGFPEMNPKRWLSSPDPKRSISSLHSRRSAKPNFCAMEIYEAVIGGLALPAMNRR